MERAVAIKVLSSKAARDPHVAERLIREQQALSALKGTAAVEVFDVCRGNEGELCLVMELLTGIDLDEFLYSIEKRDERLELFRVAEIFDPIVDTLEVAHRAGILHRDLKPANVFLLEDGGVRLLDFGLARLKRAAPLTAAGTIMGSPSFMAPEAWKGRSELVDHRADVYSLGVILFRVLAGALPFAGESLHEKFLGSTKSARPSLLALRPDLPRHADDWVTLALAVDRSERFQNVRALWNAFLSTFHVKPPARGKRHRSFWAVAKGAAKKIAGGFEKPAPELSEPPREPSFGREELARTLKHTPTPFSDEIEAQAAAAQARSKSSPARRPPSAPPPHPPAPRKKLPEAPTRSSSLPFEPTIELSEVDLATGTKAEKTLELSETDLVVEPSSTEIAQPSETTEPHGTPPSAGSNPGSASKTEKKKPPPRRRRERSKERLKPDKG
jgi:serine/threonine-protein kinase